MERYLVLDIGGTFVKYALMNREGQFIEQGKEPADTSGLEGMKATLEAIRAKFEGRYDGVACSMPGRIDTAAGIAHTGGAFVWISELPFGATLEEVFGKPATIANDGKCAALAESWTGALADVENGAVLVLGTGIGGGIVLNHQVVMGSTGGAGELSWLITNFALATDDAHLQHGMLDYAWCGQISASAIVRGFAKAKGVEKSDGVALFDAYEAGDEDAKAVIGEFADRAAAGILCLQSVLDLQRYAIGGGISARPETTQVIADAVDRVFDTKSGLPFSKPEVVRCQFGPEANLIGALAFHLRRIG